MIGKYRKCGVVKGILLVYIEWELFMSIKTNLYFCQTWKTIFDSSHHPRQQFLHFHLRTTQCDLLQASATIPQPKHQSLTKPYPGTPTNSHLVGRTLEPHHTIAQGLDAFLDVALVRGPH